MFDYESIKYAYDAGWADEKDLEQFVYFGAITEEQMHEILGIDNDLPEVEEPTIEEPLEDGVAF